MVTRTEATTTTLPPEPTPVKPPVKPRSRRFYVFGATAAISILALGSAFYAIVTNVQLNRGTEQQINTLLNQINMLKQQQNEDQTKLDNALETINDSQEKLQNKVSIVDKNVQSSLQQRQYQSKDWLLLKTRYYLELAQINAQWSDNWQTTSALLQQADVLLADIHDQRLFNVRKAIAKEISELKTMPKPDTAGLLSQLDAALGSITSLALKPAVTKEEENNTADTLKNTASGWQERMKESVGLLEKLVVVRRHNEDIVPLPSPVYESMLREGIRLNLQEAQWAVLQNNEVVYQLSLTQAIKNIKRSFALNATSTNALLKQLQDLQQVHLVQQKPLLDQSLLLLNQVIESKDSTTPAGDNS